MAVTITQFKESADGNIWATDGIEALTFDVSVAAGSYVVVAFCLPAVTRTVSSVVDNGSGGTNTYALLSQGGQDATVEANTGGLLAEMWFYGAQIERAMTTVTVTLSSAVALFGKLVIWELDGQHATTPVEDVAVATHIQVTDHVCGPVTTAAAGRALLGMAVGAAGVWSNDATYTEAANEQNGSGWFCLAGHRTVDAGSTSYTPTSSGTEDDGVVMVAIQPAAAGASAALTGTAVGGITEADIVAGGDTIIITLTGDTWISN